MVTHKKPPSTTLQRFAGTLCVVGIAGLTALGMGVTDAAPAPACASATSGCHYDNHSPCHHTGDRAGSTTSGGYADGSPGSYPTVRVPRGERAGGRRVRLHCLGRVQGRTRHRQ